MLDIVTGNAIRTLIDWANPPCVSIYLPTARSGRETLQGPIRFGNLLRDARQQLESSGMRSPEAVDLLDEARVLTEETSFWQHQEDGLAIFVAPGLFQSFRTTTGFPEIAVVGDAFHIKPLLRARSGDGRFAVIALSRGQVNIYDGTRAGLTEIALPEDMPQDLAAALWFEDREKQLQHHSADRVGRGNVVAAFHGHGTPDENDEERDLKFLRAVDAGVVHLIDRSRPLVPAGLDELVALYRKASDHPNLTGDSVSGNPRSFTREQLHERAWTIVEPLFRAQLEEDRERLGADGIAGIEDVVQAATLGKVAALFVAGDGAVWGRADPDSLEVETRESRLPGDRDLVDLAAATVWERGGRVHFVEEEDLPEQAAAAAVLRY